jgi:hypothetical protein
LLGRVDELFVDAVVAQDSILASRLGTKLETWATSAFPRIRQQSLSLSVASIVFFIKQAVYKIRLLERYMDILRELMADIRRKPTIVAGAKDRSDRMDKDCLYHRPKP